MSSAVISVNALAASHWHTSTHACGAVTSAVSNSAHHTTTAPKYFAFAPAFNFAAYANKAKYVKSGSWSSIG